MSVRLRPAAEGDLERLRAITVASKAHWGHDPAQVRQWVAAEDFPGAALARGEAALDLGQGGKDVSVRGRADPR